MKNFIVFTVLILTFANVAIAAHAPISLQSLTFKADDGVIVVIHPRSDDTHEIQTINAAGQAVLTIFNDDNEIMQQSNVLAPLEMIINTSSYSSGVYTVVLTIDGQDYSAQFSKE